MTFFSIVFSTQYDKKETYGTTYSTFELLPATLLWDLIGPYLVGDKNKGTVNCTA